MIVEEVSAISEAIGVDCKKTKKSVALPYTHTIEQTILWMGENDDVKCIMVNWK